MIDDGLGLLDGLLDARYVALERRLCCLLRVREQLLDGLHRQLHLRLGVVYQRVDLLLRRVALFLEILLRLIEAGRCLLRGIVGVLLCLGEQALAELTRGLDRLVEQLLRGFVRLLCVVEQRLSEARRLLREFHFQLLELGLGRLVRLLALGEHGLRVLDGLLGVGLRPLHRMVGGALRVRLQLLRLGQRGLDLLLRLVDRLADHVLRGAALVVEVLLRAVVLRALLLVHLGRVVLRFLQIALTQLARRGDGLVEQLLRHRHGADGLIDDGLRGLLGLRRHLCLQLGQLLLRRFLRGFAIGVDGLRLIDRRFGCVLVPAPGLLGRLGRVRVELLHLGQRRLDLIAGAIDQRRDLVVRLGRCVVELLVRRIVIGRCGVARGSRALLHVVDVALRDLAHGLPCLLHELVRLVERDLGLGQEILHGLGAVRSQPLELVARGLRLVEQRLQLVARGLGRVERMLRFVLREVPRLLGSGLALVERLLRLLQRSFDLRLQLLARRPDLALALLRGRVEGPVRILGGSVRVPRLLHRGLGDLHRLIVLRHGRAVDRGVIRLAALEQHLDLLDQILEGLLHLRGHIVVRAFGGVPGRVRFALQLTHQRLRGLRDVLGALPVLRLRLLDGLLELLDQLLRQVERLEAVLLRLLHRRGEVLELLDVGLVRVVELLRFVDLLLHLDRELLRLGRPLADLLLDLLEGLRQHAVGLIAAMRGQHGIHLVDELLQDLFHVLGNVRIGLLGGRLARLCFLLRLVERGLAGLDVGLRPVEVVLLRLVERGLALVEDVLALFVGLLPVVLGVLGVGDESLDLLEVGLVVVVELLRLVDLRLDLAGELLRLRGDLADQLLHLGDGALEHALAFGRFPSLGRGTGRRCSGGRTGRLRRQIRALGGVVQQLLDGVDDELHRVLHRLRHLVLRLVRRLEAGLAFLLRVGRQQLGVLDVLLCPVKVVRPGLRKRVLALRQQLLRLGERFLAVLLRLHGVLGERLDLVEVRLDRVVVLPRFVENLLRLGGKLLALRGRLADALLHFGNELIESGRLAAAFR